ncbi:MAG TPA: hypothetical protein VMX57_04610 [Planctomycetota bacterium]|nr:hypothetical protein [Planctomycetota bacterium]
MENENSLKNLVNTGNPNALGDQFRALALGDMLRALPTFLRKKAPAADGGSLATLAALVLAEDGKASSISRATVRAGGVTGELTVVAYGATPSTGEIAVGPNGDIVTLAADAITDLDVVYQPEKYDTVEVTLTATAGVVTIPATFSGRGVVLLLDATATTGTATGRKIVLAPGAGAPAAGQARLNIAKSTVTFAAADAVTAATLKLAVASAIDVDALLTAITTIA